MNTETARSGARRSCETEYENASSSRLAILSSSVRSRTFFLEALLLDAQLAHGQRAFEHRQGGGELDGLLDVVERAGLHGGDRGFERAVPGHDDRDQRRVDELRGFHEIDAVGARHLQIGQQQVEAAFAHGGQRLGRRR